MGQMAEFSKGRKNSDITQGFNRKSKLRVSAAEFILVICAILVILTGLGIFAASQYAQLAAQTEKLLASIASQKADKIASFFKFHLIAAQENSRNKEFSSFGANIARSDSNKESLEMAASYLTAVAESYHYSASILFSQDFSMRWSTIDNIFVDEAMLSALRQSGAESKPVVSRIFNIPPLGKPGFAVVYVRNSGILPHQKKSG